MHLSCSVDYRQLLRYKLEPQLTDNKTRVSQEFLIWKLAAGKTERLEDGRTQRLFWMGCWHWSHACPEWIRWSLWFWEKKKEPPDQTRSQPGASWASEKSPMFCSLVPKECSKKLQHVSGLRRVWYPLLRAFCSHSNFPIQRLQFKPYLSAAASFHYVWCSHIKIPKMLDEIAMLNRVCKFKQGGDHLITNCQQIKCELRIEILRHRSEKTVASQVMKHF